MRIYFRHSLICKWSLCELDYRENQSFVWGPNEGLINFEIVRWDVAELRVTENEVKNFLDFCH